VSTTTQPVLPVIDFTRSPAWVTIGDGLSLAARYWARSWERWVLAVVAVSLADGLATWLIGSTLLDQQAMARLMLPGAEVDPSLVPRLLAAPLAVAVVSLVADWFLYANAVAGLRGRDVALGWVLRSGVRVLLALLVLAVLFTAAILLLGVLGPAGLLAILFAFPVLIYVAIRCTFWVLGVFDGLGIEAAIRTSWEITRGGMLRIVGWSFALIGLSLLVSLSSGLVAAMFAIIPVVPAVVGSLLATTFQAFTLIVMAILYESQRLRWLAGAGAPYQQVSAPPAGWGRGGGYGAGPIPPSDPAPPADDSDGPPQPPPPPRDPWRG
jgi:hypothetical protein